MSAGILGSEDRQAITYFASQNQIKPEVSDVRDLTNPSDVPLQSGHGTPDRTVTAPSRDAGRTIGPRFSRVFTDLCDL